MPNNQNEDETLAQFRHTLQEQLISKGIIPPRPDSPEEIVLYQRWLKGREKLKQLPHEL